jgi:hypothetical protein
MSEQHPVQHDFDPQAEAQRFTDYDKQAQFQKEWLGLGDGATPEEVAQAAKDTVEYLNSRPTTDSQESSHDSRHYNQSMGQTDREKSMKDLVTEQVQAELNSDRTRANDIQAELNARVIKSGAKRDEKYDDASKGQIEREAHKLNMLYNQKNELKGVVGPGAIKPEAGSPSYKFWEAAREYAHSDEGRARSAEAAARKARDDAERARKEAEDKTESEESIEDDGFSAGGDDDRSEHVKEPAPEEDEEPKPLPKPAEAEEEEDPFPEPDADRPERLLDDPYRNKNAFARWIAGHKSATLTGRAGRPGRIKTPLRNRLTKSGREEAAAARETVFGESKETTTPDKFLQAAGTLSPKVRLLAERIMDVTTQPLDFSSANSLKDVKRIINEAQSAKPVKPTKAGRKVDEAMSGVENRYEVRGNQEVSEADSRAQMSLIRGATMEQIQSADFWDNNGLSEDTMSPAAVRLAEMRLNQGAAVEAAQQRAADEATARQAKAEEKENKPRLRDRLRRNRNEADEVNIGALREATGQDQANQLRNIANARGTDTAVRLVANDLGGPANLSPEALSYYRSILLSNA